jgi:hypothetical protein
MISGMIGRSQYLLWAGTAALLIAVVAWYFLPIKEGFSPSVLGFRISVHGVSLFSRVSA